MTDEIIARLRCPYSAASEPPCEECTFCAAIAEIERLRAALALAVGELSTHGEYTAWTPEMLMNQFLEEARRG